MTKPVPWNSPGPCSQCKCAWPSHLPECPVVKGEASANRDDSVNHPKHYTNHPSGIECIQVTEHMNFCLGNAVKYIWRADLKADAIEDLKKARWYIEREIARREHG